MEQKMAENQIRDLAGQFIDALHSLEDAGDMDAEPLAMLFREDATLTNAALELTGKGISGRDGIMQFWIDYKNALGKARSHFHHVTTSEQAAGLFWTTNGTTPDGQPIHYHGASLLEFDEGGLIKFFRGYYDTRELTIKALKDIP